MQLNISFDTLVNLVEDNPSEWAIFVLSAIGAIIYKIWNKFSESRQEDAFVLRKFHGYLTDFVNLYDSYQRDPHSYMGNRLEDKMEIISHNITHLVSRSELKIDSGILGQLKGIANNYDSFAHRIKCIGESIDDELTNMYSDTLKIKELLENRIK